MCPGSGHLLARHPVKNEGSRHRPARWASPDPSRGGTAPSSDGPEHGGGGSKVPLAPCPPHTGGHPVGTGPHMAGLRRRWTVARLRVALPAGCRPHPGHLWVGAHDPISTPRTRKTALPPRLPRHPSPVPSQTRDGASSLRNASDIIHILCKKIKNQCPSAPLTGAIRPAD